MKFYLALFLFLFQVITFSKEKFISVTEPNSVRVIQNGKEYFLKVGDLIQIQNKDGWKRNIRIITTINRDLSAGPAHLGDVTYKEHVELGRFKKVLSTKERVIKKKITVVGPDGYDITLHPGDKIKIKDKDGWKRRVEIISSKKGSIGSAYLGDETYQKYKQSEVFTSVSTTDEPVAKLNVRNASLESLIERLLEEDETRFAEDGELEVGVEVEKKEVSCPKVGKIYKLERFINITKVAGKSAGVPKESIIKIISRGKKCELEILKLPRGSTLKLPDFPKVSATFPSNLNLEFLTEVEDPGQSIDLNKGISFKLSDGASIHAYGRRTGKRYSFDSKNKIKIVGIHRNGDYIVKSDGKRWEYRIPAEDLEELNEEGGLLVSLEDSIATVIEENLVEEALDTVTSKVDCEDVVISSNNTPYKQINFQKCTNKNYKNSKGKTIRANNYMEKEIPLNSNSIDKILADPDKKRYANCISKSLRHGTNRNSSPSCKKDSNGKVIPARIRQAKYVTREGKKKFVGWSLLHRKPRACASKKLSSFLSDRYVDMTKCLGLDPRELFPIINHESHFQPKTISPSYAMGVGQIVTVNYLDFYNKLNMAKRMIKNKSKLLNYTKDFNTDAGYAKYENTPGKSKKVDRLTAFFLSDLRDKLNSSKKSCKGLKELTDNSLVIPKSAKKSTKKLRSYLRARENQRLCAPKNPDEGFYMAAVYYMYNKKFFKYKLNKLNSKNNMNLSNKQIKDFSIILTRWSYNAGVAGISGPFERLLEKLKKGSIEKLNSSGDPIKNRDGTLAKMKVSGLSDFSSSQFKKYMSYVIKHRYKSKSEKRRNEVSRYVTGYKGTGGIDGDLKQTERGEEASCGISY